MNCEHCQEQLIEYVHDEVEVGTREAIALHLAECSSCALEFCRLRADVEGIARAYTTEAPSASVRQALRDRVARRFAPTWWQRLAGVLTRPVPAYGVVAAAVLPVLAWVAVDHQQTSATEPAPAMERPAKITDYDATAPLLDPRIL